MEKTIVAFGLILIGAVLQANSLKCYVCDNCESVTENHLQNCSDSTSGTTQNPSVTTQNTNNPGTTVTAPGTTESTTNAPAVGTTNAPTAAPSDLDDIEVGKLYDDYDDYFKSIRADNVTHICWKDSKTVNGTTTVSRGCGTARTCEANQLTVSCFICEGDKCNTASYLPVSAFLLVSVTCLSIFFNRIDIFT